MNTHTYAIKQRGMHLITNCHKFFLSISESNFFLLNCRFSAEGFEPNVGVKDNKMETSVEKTGSEKRRVAICTNETES